MGGVRFAFWGAGSRRYRRGLPVVEVASITIPVMTRTAPAARSSPQLDVRETSASIAESETLPGIQRVLVGSDPHGPMVSPW